jgi:DNA-binding response OmpR family regulator
MNIEHRTSNAQHPMVPDETIGRLMFAISVGRASSQPDPDEPRWLKTVHGVGYRLETGVK